MVQAGTVAVGDLVFHNCPLIIADGKLLDGIDGVIPLSLFAGFLDAPGHYREEPSNCGRTRPAGRLKTRASLTSAHPTTFSLSKATLNDSREGYVLLDTGASFNVISEGTARALKYPRLFGSAVPLRSGTGAIEGTAFPMEVRFRFGSRVVAANPVVVVGPQSI